MQELILKVEKVSAVPNSVKEGVGIAVPIVEKPKGRGLSWRSGPEGGHEERRLETWLKHPSAPSCLALRTVLALTNLS